MIIVKKNKLLVSLGVAAATYAVVGGTIYYEVMHRKAKIPGLVDKSMSNPKKKNNASDKNTVKKEDERLEWIHTREFEEHDIVSERGVNLKGYYYPAEKPSKVFVLGSHGYRSSGKGQFRFVAKALHDLGFNLFFVDHQAAGKSEGNNITFGYHESRDLRKWVDYLVETYGEDIEIILYGISMGSATVMLLSKDPTMKPYVRFIIADCGFTTMKRELEHNLNSWKIPREPVVTTANIIGKLVEGYSFKDVSPLDSVKTSQYPILFFHGGSDNFVPTDMVYDLYDACTSEKDLLVVPGAKHTDSYIKAPEQYIEKIKEFSEKYL